MRKNTLSLIFRPIIRPKFPAFYLSHAATKRRKEREKNGFQFKAYLGRKYRQMSVFPALISAGKKNSGLVTSATKKILKNGFHRAKEHFEPHFSAYHSAEISGILHFQSRHDKPERDKNKRISFLCVNFPDLSWDVTFTGTDFDRKIFFRLIKFGYRKDIEKRISPCERTLWPSFFGLSFGRNFRHFTFPIPPRKARKR